MLYRVVGLAQSVSLSTQHSVGYVWCTVAGARLFLCPFFWVFFCLWVVDQFSLVETASRSLKAPPKIRCAAQIANARSARARCAQAAKPGFTIS